MKSVTVTLPDEIACWLRVEAASQGLSMSRYLARLIEAERAKRSDADAQLFALATWLSLPPVPLSDASGRLPSREELYRQRFDARHRGDAATNTPAGVAEDEQSAYRDFGGDEASRKGAVADPDQPETPIMDVGPQTEAQRAIASFVAGPKWPMSTKGRLPSRRDWEDEGID